MNKSILKDYNFRNSSLGSTVKIKNAKIIEMTCLDDNLRFYCSRFLTKRFAKVVFANLWYIGFK